MNNSKYGRSSTAGGGDCGGGIGSNGVGAGGICGTGESNKEEFRKYLQQSDVLDVLTKALVTLYEAKPDHRPDNALQFLRQYIQSGGIHSQGVDGDDDESPADADAADDADASEEKSSTNDKKNDDNNDTPNPNDDDDDDEVTILKRHNETLQKENKELRIELERLKQKKGK
jgi:hypothetical protein